MSREIFSLEIIGLRSLSSDDFPSLFPDWNQGGRKDQERYRKGRGREGPRKKYPEGCQPFQESSNSGSELRKGFDRDRPLWYANFEDQECEEKV